MGLDLRASRSNTQATAATNQENATKPRSHSFFRPSQRRASIYLLGSQRGLEGIVAKRPASHEKRTNELAQNQNYPRQ